MRAAHHETLAHPDEAVALLDSTLKTANFSACRIALRSDTPRSMKPERADERILSSLIHWQVSASACSARSRRLRPQVFDFLPLADRMVLLFLHLLHKFV